MPGYVTLSYGLGMLGLPLAIFVPPPAVVARRATLVTMLFLFLGLSLAAAGATLLALDHWNAGLAVGGGSLATLFLMFWAAAPGRNDVRDDDGEEPGGGGGGTGPKRPEDDPPAPDGSGLDWDDFDRFRDQWADEHAPSRELIPC